MLSTHAYAQTAADVLTPAPVDLGDILNPNIPEEEALEYLKVMGKALFWDQQVGSDGVACASCHYAAGADIRTKNQLNPRDGELDWGSAGLTASGGTAGPNYEFVDADFPFHQLSDDTDRNSAVVFDMNDRAGSQGSFDSHQVSTQITVHAAKETCELEKDEFYVTWFGGRKLPTRMVTGRNTPSAINAVFYKRNFWDGRANDVFNGKSPFGNSESLNNPLARILAFDGADITLETMAMDDASLASQAVGPPLSMVEMSCDGRDWAFIGAKLLNGNIKPLASQEISPFDSILGPWVDDLRGSLNYAELTRRAINPKYWAVMGYYGLEEDGLGGVDVVPTDRASGYQVAEWNFSMIFGVAVMMYERELISNQSKVDTAEDVVGCLQRPAPPATTFGRTAVGGPLGGDPSPFPPQIVDLDSWTCDDPGVDALTTLETDGSFLFHSGFFVGPLPYWGYYDPATFGTGNGNDSRSLTTSYAPQAAATDAREVGVGGRCASCHAGRLFSAATFTATTPFDPITNAGGPATDTGFFNLGGRPVEEDIGNAGLNGLGETLSAAMRAKLWLMGELPRPEFYASDDDPLICGTHFPTWDGCDGGTVPAAELVVNDVWGAVKTPILRNVALTPPYFHYGGYGNLEDVVRFYARGGNRVDLTPEASCPTGIRNDTSGTGLIGDTFPVPAGECLGSNVAGNVVGLNLALEDICPRVEGTTDPDPSCEHIGKDQEYGIQAIVAYLKAYTDPRVQCDAEPFDHPQLLLTHGHTASAQNLVAEMPAVGAAGYDLEGFPELCLPNSGDLFAPDMQNRVIPKYTF